MKEKSFTERAYVELEVEQIERIEAARIAKEKRLISQAKQLIKQKNDLLKQIEEIDEKLEKIDKGEEIDIPFSINVNSEFLFKPLLNKGGITNVANFKC